MLFLAINIQFANCQQINTLYFMEEVPVRHMLNPAFHPISKYYISLPIIGLTQLAYGNNSINFKDIVYKKNDKTITFLHPEGSIEAFYNKLKPTTVLNADLQTDLISLGFANGLSYWNFSVNEKMESSLFLPKDIFKLGFYGTPKIDKNNYNFNQLKSLVSLYTEASIGYSVNILEQLRIGAKLKFLYGTSNMSLTNNNLSLNANFESWNLIGNGSLNYAGPTKISTSNTLNSFVLSAPVNIYDWLKPAGLGGAFDVGFELRLTQNLYFSGAVTDIGFINWKRNAINLDFTTDFMFDGFAKINSSMDLSSLNAVFQKLGNINLELHDVEEEFINSIQIDETEKKYTTKTTAKINLAAEYKMLSNKMSIGVLYYEQYTENYRTKELTTSVNLAPLEWFSTSLSYSILNGYNTFGAGLSFRTGFVNWFTAVDYFPSTKITLPTLKINNDLALKNLAIPYNLNYYNISVGINLVFGKMEKQNSNQRFNRRTGLYRSKFKTKACNCDYN